MNAAQRKEIENIILNLSRFDDEDNVKEEGVEEAVTAIEDATNQLEAILADEEEKYENMPEGLQNSDRGYQMEEGIGTLETIIHLLEGVELDPAKLEEGWEEKLAEVIDEAVAELESLI